MKILSNSKLDIQWGNGSSSPLMVFDAAGPTGPAFNHRQLLDQSRNGHSVNTHTAYSSGYTGGPPGGASGPGGGAGGSAGSGSGRGGSFGGVMGGGGGSFVGGQNPGFHT